jgi:hypothetical protein
MKLNAPILNREFKHPTDGWYHLEALGVHLNAEAGIKQVIDDEACTAIVNRFNTEADGYKEKRGIEFPGMLIDHEHFRHDTDKESRAYGWLMRLQNRADGFYGKINWTGTGRAAVDSGDYRFFSTEYDPANLKILNKEGKITNARPLRLDGITLTNQPNNKGQRPITNRQNNLPGAPVNSPAGDPVDNKGKNTMKQIATRLGLSADASEEAILGEITKIENRATKAEGQLAPLTEENTTLKNRVSKIESDQADADLAAAGIKPDDADHATIKQTLLTNREGGLALLKKIKAPVTEVKKPLTNRAGASVPGGQADGSGNEKADAVRTVAIRNRAAQLQAQNSSMTIASAFIAAGKQVDEELAAAK